MRKMIVSLLALCGGVCLCSAAVTVQGWWHLDSTQPINDSSGLGRTFTSAYSTAPAAGGNFAGQLINNGAGGPLGTTGYTSTQCVRAGVGVGGKRQSSMWAIGYNPPAQDYGIEIWVLPQDNGIAGGTGGYIFDSGTSGGVALRINAPGTGPSYIDAFVVGPGTTIGEQVPIDTNNWMHLAIVNDGGVVTFYTNGIPCGLSITNGVNGVNLSTPSGDVYLNSAPGDNQAFDGYLDEARMFTFAAGAFTTNDLLLRPSGPSIVGQPQGAVVWDTGAVAFTITPSFQSTLQYQWRRNGTNVSGATSGRLYLNQVSGLDSGSTFDCIVSSGGINVTSTVANLTVVTNNAANIAAYRDAVNGEASLLAYFPVDGDTGATVTNTKDNTHNGTLDLGASYDGQTNDTFGARSLSFNLDGDVQIPNNPAFEFAGGNGTIEAVVYMAQATASPGTIFAENFDYNPTPYYGLQVSADGGSLIYTNDIAILSWNVPGGMVGHLSHVALVFSDTTNVTAYVNGQNLGTQTQAGFGYNAGAPVWIGGLGDNVPGGFWSGTVDELAVYGSALSQNDIQIHYSAFAYGTNTAAPTIVSQPVSKTILAGGSPVLSVQAAGTLPISYQWTSNDVPVAGATSSTLAISNIAASVTYGLSIQNPYGTTNIQPVVVTITNAPSGYPAMVMNDHPTAFWRLNDSAGQPTVDSAGFNDGAYTANGVTYGVPAHNGENGTAVELDGSSGCATVPNSSSINPNGPFTIEFWAHANSEAFYVPLSSMPRSVQQRSGGYEFYLDGNYPGYEFHTAAGGGYNMITGDDTVPAGDQWFQVVGVYDGVSNIFCYVNGRPAASTTGNPGFSDSYLDEGAPPFAPNTIVGLHIGKRDDNSHFFSGAISDVAFYNYDLSAAQVSNHWASAYVAAKIVFQPVGVTNVEGSPVTLACMASGLPNTYLWYKGGTALTASLNSDGSAHYPLDVTNASLAISETVPNDSGQYHVVVSNPLGGATSDNATVLITADTNPPAVTAVQALGTPSNYGEEPAPFLVKVWFNKRVDPATGGTTANYAINNATVTAVTVRGDLQATTLGSDWMTAVLQTTGLTPGQQYTLTVSGVKDQAQTPNTIVPQPVSFEAPQLVQGALWWDYYYEITPQGVGSLQGSGLYTGYDPTTNASLTSFDTDLITQGDLNNNPAFGSLGDNYGDVVSGWITPTVTGDYTFFLCSDDASELDLSPDSNPLNAIAIATQSAYVGGAFVEPPDARDSAPQTLQAGTSYFIRALHTEGGGGDFVKVAWRISTDSTPAANLTPIPGQYLSAYVSQSAAPPTFDQPPVYSNGQLTLYWSGQGTLLESTNVAAPFSSWTKVPGSPSTGPYTLQVTPGIGAMFYRLSQ